MRYFESRTSKNILNNPNIKNYNHHNFKSELLTLKVLNKIIDYTNLLLVCLIIIYSFISFNSLREWTEIYSSMNKIRLINNDLNGYIATTEEYFINEVEMKDQFKKTTSKDLIYLKKPIKKINNKFPISDFIKGLLDGKFQRGY